jgi:hypothetical protein
LRTTCAYFADKKYLNWRYQASNSSLQIKFFFILLPPAASKGKNYIFGKLTKKSRTNKTEVLSEDKTWFLRNLGLCYFVSTNSITTGFLESKNLLFEKYLTQ